MLVIVLARHKEDDSMSSFLFWLVVFALFLAAKRRKEVVCAYAHLVSTGFPHARERQAAADYSNMRNTVFVLLLLTKVMNILLTGY
jgi:hypothetical protein